VNLCCFDGCGGRSAETLAILPGVVQAGTDALAEYVVFKGSVLHFFAKRC
jgi:hypothetical protein